MLKKVLIALICLLFILSATNPSHDQYLLWAKSKIQTDLQQNEDLEKNQNAVAILSSVASTLIERGTTETNAGIFTLFFTAVGPHNYKVLGIGNQFIILNHHNNSK